MTEPSTSASHGYVPPVAAENGSPPSVFTSHALAEAKAQAAAARRLRTPVAADHAKTDYTGLVTRAIAFGIDALIINLVGFCVAAIVALALNLLQVPSQIDTVLAAIGAVALILWAAAYFVTFWSTTGQTPGARVMRFRVLAPAADGGKIGPRRGLVRLVGMTLA